ncbi:MAG: pyroglutamyl-peptidase I [Oscillospiraceae bacterium]|nr:pyroglutamyl-peptidase I [Oscillospiraceae bacterium]
MKKLLITGFDPFDGQTINPSWEAVRLLPEKIGNYELCKLQLPTCYGDAPRILLEKAEEICPDLIISIGQAGGRANVTPERIAINIRDSRRADNSGRICSGERIDPEGDAAYFSTLPVEAMAEAICADGLPGAVSNTAGTFVCNDVLYNVLRHFDGTNVRAGFIHVPYLPEQGEPNLPLSDTVRGLTAAIKAIS